MFPKLRQMFPEMRKTFPSSFPYLLYFHHNAVATWFDKVQSRTERNDWWQRVNRQADDDIVLVCLCELLPEHLYTNN